MSSNSRRMFSTMLVVLGLATLGLSSCLKMEMDIRLYKNGTARTTLKYEIDSSVADFGRGFGADEKWPIPLMENDFRQQALRHPGVELVKYKSRLDKRGYDRIEVVLDAQSLEALSRYLNVPLGVTAVGTGDTNRRPSSEGGDSPGGDSEFALPGSGSFTLSPLSSSTAVAGLSESVSESFQRLLSETVLVFRFRGPVKPKTVNRGQIKGSGAEWETTISELITSNELQNWRVSW